MSGKVYLYRFVVSLVCSLFIVFLFTIAVDPFGAFGIISIQGVNTPKPHAEKNEKLGKSLRIAITEPRVLILGTSRAEIGLDPNVQELEARGRPYNLAVPGASPYVIRRFLQHALAAGDIDTVVLGLDFFSYNINRVEAPDFSEDYFMVTSDGSWNPFYYVDSLVPVVFSMDAVSKSYDTLINASSYSGAVIDIDSGVLQFAYKGKVMPLRDKETEGLRIDSVKKNNSKRPNKKSFNKMEVLYMKWVYMAAPRHEYRFTDAETGRSTLDDLENIIELCRVRKVDLYMFISPAHARQLEVIRVSGLWGMFEQWKREVTSIVDNSDHSDAHLSLWDFSGYNVITTESVPEFGRMENYLDSTHYRVNVGDKVLAKIMAPEKVESKGFGRLLSEATIDEVLRAIRGEQERYHLEHSQDVAEIEQLKNEMDADLDHVSYTGAGRTLEARAIAKPKPSK